MKTFEKRKAERPRTPVMGLSVDWAQLRKEPMNKINKSIEVTQTENKEIKM